MNRRTLILFLVLLAVLTAGIGVAVAFLYSDTGKGGERTVTQVAEDDRYLLFHAFPSDAVLVACVDNLSEALPGMYDSLDLSDDFADLGSAVSLHYSGELTALYAFDLGKSSAVPSDRATALIEDVREKGFVAEYIDCSSYQGAAPALSAHSIVLASRSETLLKSSLRHISKSVSVFDATGFASACSGSAGNDLIFVSNTRAGNILPAAFTRRYASCSNFFTRLCDWTVFAFDVLENGVSFHVMPVYDKDADEFMSVMSSSVPAVSSVSKVLPSYTVGAFSLPLNDIASYVNAYEKYLDSRQGLHLNKGAQRELASRTGMAPLDLVHSLSVEEVTKAFFRCGETMENILLIKSGNEDFRAIVRYAGTDDAAVIDDWSYPSAISTVFGKLFSLQDETCFTCIGDWIVVGSKRAVEEYSSGRALEYTLEEYMTDASVPGMMSRAKSAFVSYFSFSADVPFLSEVFRKDFLEEFGSLFTGAEFCPIVLAVNPDKKGVHIDAKISRLSLQKTKAPVFERDTVVHVPEGPFDVKNSGTGKMNRFYQNRHLSLCLSQDGKDLWGVPFKKSICGTAQNIDYFANGKLQIAFGAGSQIYIIDRLGRFVNGFPIDLGKDILIGPDVYDFNGTKKYNMMVLHKDNTIEMYNFKGQKPASWKGICPSETIKALPEDIKVGGNTFWVVRTSIQTLIYPFYGGEPLTKFEGEQMIRPDSEVKALDAVSVDVVCYDGKHRTVKLK